MSQDSFTCVYDMTHSCVYVTWLFHVCVTWLIHVSMWHDSFMCVCDMNHSCGYVMWHAPFMRERHASATLFWHRYHVCMGHDSLMSLWDMTHAHIYGTWLIHVCMSRDSFMCVCHMPHSRVRDMPLPPVLWPVPRVEVISLICVCVAVWCSVLQCVAVRCSALQCVEMITLIRVCSSFSVIKLRTLLGWLFWYNRALLVESRAPLVVRRWYHSFACAHHFPW